MDARMRRDAGDGFTLIELTYRARTHNSTGHYVTTHGAARASASVHVTLCCPRFG